MADIELVIKIPEWKYKSICEGVEASKRSGVVGVAPTIYEAIYNGTPLPKGHGRIADIDKLLEEMRATRTYDIPFALERVKPIIEADKEYEAEVINRGNCMICGKKLDEDEDLFFCKECEAKAEKEEV